MEEDLDRPIVPYDEQDTGRNHNRFSLIDILDEKAEHWEQRSGTFRERTLPHSYGQDDVQFDTSYFDGPPLSPIRSNEPSLLLVDQSGNPIRNPVHQSTTITASALFSTSATSLPQVQPNDLPWATGKTTTSPLPRADTMYHLGRD